MSVSDETVPFISDQLDEFFGQFGVNFERMIAGVAIALGLFLAAVGSRYQGPKLLGFISGFLVGCFLGAIVLETADKNNQLENETWVGLFFAAGIIVGILTFCVVTFAPIIVGIATGLIVVGVLYQVGLASVINNDVVMLIIALVSCLIGVYLACKVLDLIYAILAAFLGAAFVILGVGSFTNSPVTLNVLISNPENALDDCNDNDCRIPLGAGVVVLVCALAWNVFGYRQKEKKKKKAAEAKDENARLMNQMQDDRQNFEKRFKDLENNNTQLMKSLEENAAGTEKTILTAFQKEIAKQEKGTMQRMAVLEKQLTLQKKELDLKDKEQQKAIAALETEKKALQLQIEEEKRHQMETEALLNAQPKSAEEIEKERLNEEEKKERKAMLFALQQEAQEGKLRLEDLENDFKEAAELEKRLNIKVPKEYKKKKKRFFDDDDELAREQEEIEEMILRAEEFTKYKSLVSRTKTAQRETLRRLKKGFKEIEKISTTLRTLSMKEIDVGDEAEERVKKDKEHGLNDMTLKMGVLRSLLEKYELMNKDFIDLIAEMEQKFHDFKLKEKEIEAASYIRKKKEKFPTADLLPNTVVLQPKSAQAKIDAEEKALMAGDMEADLENQAAEVDAQVPVGAVPGVEVAGTGVAAAAGGITAAGAAKTGTKASKNKRTKKIPPVAMAADSDDGETRSASSLLRTETLNPDQLTSEQLVDEINAPKPLIYRDSYVADENRMSTAELNNYLFRYVSVKFPRFSSFMGGLKSKTANSASSLATKAKQRVFSRRDVTKSTADFDAELDVAPSNRPSLDAGPRVASPSSPPKARQLSRLSEVEVPPKPKPVEVPKKPATAPVPAPAPDEDSDEESELNI